MQEKCKYISGNNMPVVKRGVVLKCREKAYNYRQGGKNSYYEFIYACLPKNRK